MTRCQAYEQIQPVAPTMREQVLSHIKTCGVNGATDEEIQIALGLNPSTQRSHRIELQRRGFVRIGGKRKTKAGRTAIVWVSQ